MEDVMTEREKDALRITNQFRSKGSMVYDMRCDGTRLTVIVTEMTAGGWRVEARAGGADAASIEKSGPTRIDALRAVGESWAKSGSADFPTFDWTAVADALHAVRAI
jgi:hypothetical protein